MKLFRFGLLMNFKSLIILLLILPSVSSLFSQTDSIEVYLIDAYSTREIPYTFKLSFYTSDVCKSKVILEDKYEFTVSNEPVDLHKIDININDLYFNEQIVNFVIITETESGEFYKSEKFDFDLPFEPQIKEGSDLFTLCLFGSAIFLLPYPSYVSDGKSSYFSLTKEIPFISFRSRSLSYPSGYLSVEYSYIFNAENPSYLRIGYKKIIELPHTEYIAPGISLYTNFNTNQGISPELSVGLFTIKDTFTFYARYRYNITLHSTGTNFQEIYIGLYSGFFSLYLD
jgi:hypothetical protein